jgi:hypothetical protein
MISAASTSGAAHESGPRGIAKAVGAGLKFGSMYIPYRKAYITGMNPLTFLTFLTFFTFGEMTMMSAVAILFSGGIGPFCFGRCWADSCGYWATCSKTMQPSTSDQPGHSAVEY